jgi:hypothetical protein
MTAQTSPLLAALDAIEETARRADGGWQWLSAMAPREDEPVWLKSGHAAMNAYAAQMNPEFILRLVEGLREVVALHVPDDSGIFLAYSSADGPAPVCRQCVSFHADMDCENARWPCPTLAALTRALAGEEEG